MLSVVPPIFLVESQPHKKNQFHNIPLHIPKDVPETLLIVAVVIQLQEYVLLVYNFVCFSQFPLGYMVLLQSFLTPDKLSLIVFTQLANHLILYFQQLFDFHMVSHNTPPPWVLLFKFCILQPLNVMVLLKIVLHKSYRY